MNYLHMWHVGGAARAASGAGPHVPLRVTAHGRGAAGRVAEGAGEHAAAPQGRCCCPSYRRYCVSSVALHYKLGAIGR
eukprot:1157665-Pelagomonas_calceolata.AAC.4